MLNTNLTSTTISIASSYFNDNIVLYKKAGIKAIRIPHATNQALTGFINYTLGVLPETHRPIENINKTIYVNNTYPAYFNIYTNGNIVLTPCSNISSGVYFTIYETYI